MPFVINDLVPNDETATRTFDLLGSPAEITYYRNRVTLEPMPTKGTDEEVADAIAGRLCRQIADWDLEGPFYGADGTLLVAAGEPVPIEPAIVKAFPVQLTAALYGAIQTAESGGNAQRRSKR